eukprot:355061-Chlamydomonas_euryale.AAC.7
MAAGARGEEPQVPPPLPRLAARPLLPSAERHRGCDGVAGTAPSPGGPAGIRTATSHASRSSSAVGGRCRSIAAGGGGSGSGGAAGAAAQASSPLSPHPVAPPTHPCTRTVRTPAGLRAGGGSGCASKGAFAGSAPEGQPSEGPRGGGAAIARVAAAPNAAVPPGVGVPPGIAVPPGAAGPSNDADPGTTLLAQTADSGATLAGDSATTLAGDSAATLAGDSAATLAGDSAAPGATLLMRARLSNLPSPRRAGGARADGARADATAGMALGQERTAGFATAHRLRRTHSARAQPPECARGREAAGSGVRVSGCDCGKCAGAGKCEVWSRHTTRDPISAPAENHVQNAQASCKQR